MSEFKVGDRVRLVGDEWLGSLPAGVEGTIVEPDSDSGWPYLHVVWDESHNMFMSEDDIWAMTEDEVEAVA